MRPFTAIPRNQTQAPLLLHFFFTPDTGKDQFDLLSVRRAESTVSAVPDATRAEKNGGSF